MQRRISRYINRGLLKARLKLTQELILLLKKESGTIEIRAIDSGYFQLSISPESHETHARRREACPCGFRCREPAGISPRPYRSNRVSRLAYPRNHGGHKRASSDAASWKYASACRDAGHRGLVDRERATVEAEAIPSRLGASPIYLSRKLSLAYIFYKID